MNVLKGFFAAILLAIFGIGVPQADTVKADAEAAVALAYAQLLRVAPPAPIQEVEAVQEVEEPDPAQPAEPSEVTHNGRQWRQVDGRWQFKTDAGPWKWYGGGLVE